MEPVVWFWWYFIKPMDTKRQNARFMCFGKNWKLTAIFLKYSINWISVPRMTHIPLSILFRAIIVCKTKWPTTYFLWIIISSKILFQSLPQSFPGLNLMTFSTNLKLIWLFLIYSFSFHCWWARSWCVN